MRDYFADRRVVVAGGCGFIGSHLVQRLVALKAKVTVVDALFDDAGGRIENLGKAADQVEVHRFDLRCSAKHGRVFRRADLLFNLAGAAGHVESIRRPARDLARNCRANLALLETLRRVNRDIRVLAASTRQVYGRPLFVPVDESHPLRPVDVNGVHLQAVEGYYRLYHELHGIRSTCLRLTNTYGPRMSRCRRVGGFMAACLRRAGQREPIVLFGDGRQRRDLNYVDDVVTAFLQTAMLPMEVPAAFNLGHDTDHALVEIAAALHRLTGCGIVFRPFPCHRAQIDIGDYQASYQRLRDATGWRPTIGLEEGLQRALADDRRRAAERRSRTTRPALGAPLVSDAIVDMPRPTVEQRP